MRKNVTRRSSSIPRRLVREGAVHLLPVYGLLRLSDLANERETPSEMTRKRALPKLRTIRTRPAVTVLICAVSRSSPLASPCAATMAEGVSVQPNRCG